MEDDTREVKTLMLEKMPILRHMYNEDDETCKCCISKKATVVFASFGGAPEIFEI